MPRKRKGDIQESPSQLSELEEQYRKEPARAARVRMLRLLLEHPEMELADIAGAIGYSQQTVKRWLKTYRDSGIGGLLKMRLTDAGERKHDDLESLRAGIASGSIATKEDVKAWLGELESTRKQSNRGRTEERVLSNKGVDHSTGISESRGVGAVIELTKLFDFVNSLPIYHDPESWVNSFRLSLGAMLGDVDRVTVTVNIDCDLVSPETYNPQLAFSQNLGAEGKGFYELGYGEHDPQHVDRVLKMLEKRDFPFKEYYPAHAFVYYFGGDAYLGCILLWREVSKRPVSVESLTIMKKIYPFIVFLLSDLVARNKNARPVEHAFSESLKRLIQEARLTIHEQKIVALQLIGLSYEDMAATLHISPNTLRYHLRSIYRKTGTHSGAELFARYFTPGNATADKSHQ